jgi:hypothetical protein
MATTKRPKVRSIAIHGRRWFQRTYGNTYFSAEIFVNGSLVHKLEEQYGYGDQYVYAAGQWLAANGYIKLPQGTPLWTLRGAKNGIDLYYTASDVARERDL